MMLLLHSRTRPSPAGMERSGLPVRVHGIVIPADSVIQLSDIVNESVPVTGGPELIPTVGEEGVGWVSCILFRYSPAKTFPLGQCDVQACQIGASCCGGIEIGPYFLNRLVPERAIVLDLNYRQDILGLIEDTVDRLNTISHNDQVELDRNTSDETVPRTDIGRD